MRLIEVQDIVREALHRGRVIAVDYVRADGVRTTRLMDPVAVDAGARSRTGELKLWAWCRDHDRLEQRTVGNIIAITITDIPAQQHTIQGLRFD
jgi:predicted DNA-binding transcriptional regulator YafY